MEGDESRQLVKHLSKSASELSGHSLAHKTQSLFTSIKERWSRKRRGRGGEEEGQSTDYAADNSSEQSTPRTLSPRHRQSLAPGGMGRVSEGEAPWSRLSIDQAKPDPAVLTAEEKKRRRESALRQHAFFQLRVHLRRGKSLIARDKSGTSDPYVKFKVNGRLLYKSKTIYRDLNPIWDETFTLPIDDPFTPIHVKVFDYDWGLQDDFMGSAFLDLTAFELGKTEDVRLELEDRTNEGTLGELHLTITLLPKSQEDKEQVWGLEQLVEWQLMFGGIFVSRGNLSLESGVPTSKESRPQPQAQPHVPQPQPHDPQPQPHVPLPQPQPHVPQPQPHDPQPQPQPHAFQPQPHALQYDLQSQPQPPPASDARRFRRIALEQFVKRKIRKTQNEANDKFSELVTNITEAVESMQYFQRNSRISDVNRRLKSQIWSSVVTIVLIEGKSISVADSDGIPDAYAKFRLGNEKYKSRVSYKTFNPSWLEQFDLHLYDDQAQELEVSVWNKAKPKDDYIGRCLIDLTSLEREKTQRLRQQLQDCGGSISLLLTISGTTASETISDLTTYEENPREIQTLHERYSLLRTFHNLRDVGHLTVRVFKARGLASADLGGKSDPFCVLELVNARLQTQTEYKTLCPSWQKIFTFNVKDITSVLEVTVYDEDRDHKVEFLGKVAIPLLRIRNNERRWYALKDKKLYSRAKGNYPQILLEMAVIWNPVRACIRTLNPKEEKYMQAEVKFKRQVFVRNVMRLKVIIMWIIDVSKQIENLFEWESTFQSTLAFIGFVLGCYYFQPYMIPAAMLLVFLKCYIVEALTGSWSASEEEEDPIGEEEEDEDDKDKEEKKSLKERLHAIQEVTQTVQNSIGYIATLGESIKNTFNFTVPFLSYLSVALLVVGTVVLYWLPVRYLILMWGVNKFTRKLIRPHTIPNNEVLDLLSRVPDNEDLIAFRELKIQSTSEPERRRETRKKKIL